jgi:predicted HTH transcriptional regulator
MLDNGIDLIRYGALYQKVESYEQKFQEMSNKIDKLEAAIESLCAMANQSRGAIWIGLGLVSTFSAFVGFVINWYSNK